MPMHDGCFNFPRRRIDLFQYIKMLSRLVASRHHVKQPLNENVLRETYPLPSVEFTIGNLSKSKIFSKIDATVHFGRENYRNNLVC